MCRMYIIFHCVEGTHRIVNALPEKKTQSCLVN
jgi:hypothetical protein